MTEISAELLADAISAGIAEALRNNADRHTKWRTGQVTAVVNEEAASRQVEVHLDGDPAGVTVRMRSLGAVATGQRALVVFSPGGGVWCIGALGGEPEDPFAVGTVILDGHGPPTIDIGEEGNYYLDVDSDCLWGPKMYTEGFGAPQTISTGPGPATHLPPNQNHGIRLRFARTGRITKIRYQRTEAMYSTSQLEMWDVATNVRKNFITVPDTNQPAGWYVETLSPPWMVENPGQAYTFSHSNGGYGATTLPAPPVTETADVKFEGFYYGANSASPPDQVEQCPQVDGAFLPTLDVTGTPLATGRSGEVGVRFRIETDCVISGVRWTSFGGGNSLAFTYWREDGTKVWGPGGAPAGPAGDQSTTLSGGFQAYAGEIYTLSCQANAPYTPYKNSAAVVTNAAAVTFLGMYRSVSTGQFPATAMPNETYFLEPILQAGPPTCWGSNIEPTFEPIDVPVWPLALCGAQPAVGEDLTTKSRRFYQASERGSVERPLYPYGLNNHYIEAHWVELTGASAPGAQGNLFAIAGDSRYITVTRTARVSAAVSLRWITASIPNTVRLRCNGGLVPPDGGGYASTEVGLPFVGITGAEAAQTLTWTGVATAGQTFGPLTMGIVHAETNTAYKWRVEACYLRLEEL